MKFRHRYKPRGTAQQLRIARLLPTRTASLMMLLFAAAASGLGLAAGEAGNGSSGSSGSGRAESYNNPSGASVNLINAVNDSVVVHCWSRESNFGATALEGGDHYYWSFHPNIFGRTVFKCHFLWKELKQEFAVWKGASHADRPRCCTNGPCSYKICADGFYNALIVDTDDYGSAESWELFEPWLPNPGGGMQ